MTILIVLICLKTIKKERRTVTPKNLKKAVAQGDKLGFSDRSPKRKTLKPGPRRTEKQGRVTIHGPARIMEEFKNIAISENLSQWEVLELLLNNYSQKNNQ